MGCFVDVVWYDLNVTPERGLKHSYDNSIESLIEATSVPERTRAKCWRALLRPHLYIAERDRPFSTPCFSVIRGLQSADEIIPHLHEHNCCAIGGLEAKIAPVLREVLGTDMYQQCCTSLAVCLGGVSNALNEKGNDTNRESEVELRSCTAISLKHPFKTFLDRSLHCVLYNESVFFSAFSFLN